MRSLLLGLSVLFGFFVAALVAAFLLAQTPFGKSWIAREAGRLVSRPGLSVVIDGLDGLIPFRMTAKRIAIRDAEGEWLTLSGVGVDLSARSLLSGEAQIRRAAVEELRIARLPASSGRKGGSFAVPVFPIALRVDRFEVARLLLAPPVLGEPVSARLSGHAAIRGGTGQAALDLHRTDGVRGGLSFSLAFSPQRLSLHLTASEPTGILVDRLFSRSDHPPFAFSLDGTGPIGNWRGQLTASVGNAAQLSARIRLSLPNPPKPDRTVLSVTGTAALAGLLPPKFAPLLGKQMGFSLRASSDGSQIAIDSFAIDFASARIAGKGSYALHRQKLHAEVAALVPKLSALGGLVGLPVEGRLRLQAELEGRLAGSEAKKGIAIAAHGLIQHPALLQGKKLPPALSGPIAWSLSARAKGEEGRLDVTRFRASGLGLDVAGSGSLQAKRRRFSAQFGVSVPDLAKFSTLARYPLRGALLLEARAESRGSGALSLAFEGSGRKFETGLAPLDSLLGGRVDLSGSAELRSSGAFRLDRLMIAGAGADLGASGEIDSRSHLRASLFLSLPRLAPLGATLGVPLDGALAGRAKLEGPFDRIAFDSSWTGTKFSFGRARFDWIAFDAKLADLAKPIAQIDGTWSARRLGGKLGFLLKLLPNGRIALDNLRLSAPASTVAGNLELTPANGLVRGRIEGKVADLKPWSPVFGLPLQGSLSWTAELAPGPVARQAEQRLRLRAEGERLGAGSLRLGRLSLQGELADLFGAPRGKARLSLGALRVGSAEFSALSLSLASVRNGDFDFEGMVRGAPATLRLAGRLQLAKDRQELRLNRLDGILAKEPLRLLAPLVIARRGAEMEFSGLDLRLGPGRLGGSGAVRGDRLSLRLKGSKLPVAPLARLAGDASLAGSASIDVRLDGSLGAPQGRAVLQVSGLKAGIAAGVPSLGLRLEGNWQGQKVDFTGRLDGPLGDRLDFQGSLPLLFSRAPLSLSLPPEGALRASVKGGGDLAHLEGLLPLGEARISGAYKVDLSVSGTLGHPLASGRVSVKGGRYQNFTTGAVLTDLNALLEGNRERLDLRSFTAKDGDKGRIEASGTIVLQGRPRADIVATLSDFRVAAREEATATVNGKVRIEGPLAAPKITADLVSGRVELQVPKQLPPSVTRIAVTIINSKTGRGPPPKKKEAPVLPATLDLKITLPGRVFARGRGLDSEWRGKLAITGTSAQPIIHGTLSVVRGNFSFLGKSFRVERGTISIAGGLRTEPTLDIVATASAADITATVNIAGTIAAPRISLSSTPSLPQDEILSRLLFNQGVGQITPAQGFELAQAAAALAGKGPDMLGRLRGELGLDWLRFGQSASATAILNPAPTLPTQTGGTAVSAGKYISEGISVGVTQGLSPPSSKVTVGIDLRPHLSVETELGNHEGSGVGIYYKYNY